MPANDLLRPVIRQDYIYSEKSIRKSEKEIRIITCLICLCIGAIIGIVFTLLTK